MGLKLWKRWLTKKLFKVEERTMYFSDHSFPNCPNWVISDVFNTKLIEKYRQRDYFGRLPDVTKDQQYAIEKIWESEMTNRGWVYNKSIENQDKFDKDCERSWHEAIYKVMLPKVNPIVRTRFR